MSYDVTELISERLDAINSGINYTLNTITNVINGFLSRGVLEIDPAFVEDLHLHTYPIPILSKGVGASDIQLIPTDLKFPDHSAEDFDLNTLISEFDSILTEIGQNIAPPTIDSVSQNLHSISAPRIPDNLDSIESPSLDTVKLPTLPVFDKISVPYPESVTTNFTPSDVTSLTFVETQHLFEEFDSILQEELQFSTYVHSLIKDRRLRVGELVEFYGRILNALKATNPLQRTRGVIDEINQIVDEGEEKFIKPIYDRYTTFVSEDIKNKLENLYSQAKTLSEGQLQEKFYSENVFTDRDKEDEIEVLKLQLKEDLDKHEAAYMDICIQLWNLTLSYVLVYVNKLLIEFQQRIEYERVLAELHANLGKAIFQYYNLYDSLLQAGNVQLDNFKAILSKADTELNKLQSILEKNNAYIEAYAAQITGLQTLVDKYDTDRKNYQAQLTERSSRVDLAKTVYQNNQAKVDLYQRAVGLVNKLYRLRQEKIRDILNRTKAKVGAAKAQQSLDVAGSKSLEEIYNIYGDILETDVSRYNAEYNNVLKDNLMGYKTTVRLNAERANLLKQAYSVFLQKVMQENRYLLTTTRLVNSTVNKIAMEGIRPLSSMSAGLLSAIDAVVNGLYEFVAEG